MGIKAKSALKLMARRRNKGRDIDGIVIVDKPTGRSSNAILQQVKRLYNANKAGHTGSLDPLATGVLPICLGEATKLSGYLLDADKAYQVTCKLGITTDSGDVDGQVVAEHPIPKFDTSSLENIVSKFIGLQQQVPPMFSALKYQGQPLYKLARQGIEIERKSRDVEIYQIEVLNVEKDEFTLAVRCSKGTYIRTLVEDISHRMGSGGHVTMLRRTDVARYSLSDSVTLTELEQTAEQQNHVALDAFLEKPENALAHWSSIFMDEKQSKQMSFGQAIAINQPVSAQLVRLFDHNKLFVGIGETDGDGLVKPKRLFSFAVSS